MDANALSEGCPIGRFDNFDVCLEIASAFHQLRTDTNGPGKVRRAVRWGPGVLRLDGCSESREHLTTRRPKRRLQMSAFFPPKADIEMARSEGLEPPTSGFEARRSIQLS